MLLSEEPVAPPTGRSRAFSDKEPLRTPVEDGPVTFAGALDPAGSPRGLSLEGDRDRDEGMFFRPACSPGLADRTLLASTAWDPELFRTGRTDGCWALRATLLIRLSSVWPS